MNKKLMFTAAAMGAAYLMRNPESRQKLMGQVQNFSKSGTGASIGKYLNQFGLGKSSSSTSVTNSSNPN
ncbi:hypothetical protein [Paenibacillus sp. YPG26]|uniref:hypothetical protein n=1 Tax=Paenibacillus sp. YPG26 TaxID=2878915 RepID=UPI002041CB7E|nr:hypothetical protein [Paenibacillus sp. YPG26]USB31744.1 hypothetical protein LDO05_10305 [Paenibacillus sp. YPG26]